MVKKSLHEAGFSNPAIIACVRHNIHYLHELMKYYNQDKKLRMFNDVIAEVKDEILLICEEYLKIEEESEKKDQDKNTEKYESVVMQIPDNIQLGTKLEEMVKLGVLSKRTWQALNINNIIDVNDLVRHYLNNKSFRGLRNIGTLKNNEASLIAQIIIKKKNITIEAKPEPNEVFSFTAENVVPKKLKMLLEIRKNELKRSIVDYFNLKILPLRNKDEMASMLNKLVKNPKIIPSMGTKGISDLNKFLNEYKSICSNENNLSELRKACVIQRLRKLAWIDEEWIKSNDLEFGKPLKLLYNILNDSIVLKSNEHFILRNVNTFKIIEEGHGLKYEDALKKYNESQDSVTVMNTFKVWIKRTRNKLNETLDEILKELPELKLELMNIFSLSEDFVIFHAEKTDSINEENETDFSDRFFDILLSRLNSGFYSLNGPGKRRFTELAYINNDLVMDKEKLNGLLKTLSIEMEKPSIKERSIKLVTYVKECLHSDFDISNLVEFLRTQNNEIKFDGEVLIFPPTQERKMSLGELVYNVIEENNAPMHYNDIIRKFKQKYPEFKLGSYRSLRDAMDKSALITSMGGKSNHFLLNEWKARYYVGPNKEFIIEFLRKKQPAHFFEIYKHLNKKRPGLKVITVTEILTGLSELFYNHGGGYYSLSSDISIDKNKKFMRMQKGIYSLVENNRHLLTNETELIRLLKKHFPEYTDIQLEYAIYQVSEKQI